MPHYVGPCLNCGDHIDRVLRPGRRSLCVPCAIEHQQAHNRTMADGTNPDLEGCKAAGRAAADAILSRQGHVYEKWRANIIRGALLD